MHFNNLKKFISHGFKVSNAIMCWCTFVTLRYQQMSFSHVDCIIHSAKFMCLAN